MAARSSGHEFAGQAVREAINQHGPARAREAGGGMINGLDLFSGIGGISIALEPWVRTIAYCESDRYAQSVILSRIHSGELHPAPIWNDVTTLTGKQFQDGIDIIYGGFPCQDISTAGNGAGLEGEQSGLFFEICRLIGELRPRFVFLENVPAISVRGLDRVLLELTALGYDTRWTTISAASVGAAHQRERWFLLAHTDGESMRLSESGERNKAIHVTSAMGNGPASDTNGARSQGPRTKFGHEEKKPFTTDVLEGDTWDEYASFFLRVDHGLPHRSHRLKCLGNSVVPIQARIAFKRLMGVT